MPAFPRRGHRGACLGREPQLPSHSPAGPSNSPIKRRRTLPPIPTLSPLRKAHLLVDVQELNPGPRARVVPFVGIVDEELAGVGGAGQIGAATIVYRGANPRPSASSSWEEDHTPGDCGGGKRV